MPNRPLLPPDPPKLLISKISSMEARSLKNPATNLLILPNPSKQPIHPPLRNNIKQNIISIILSIKLHITNKLEKLVRRYSVDVSIIWWELENYTMFVTP